MGLSTPFLYLFECFSGSEPYPLWDSPSIIHRVTTLSLRFNLDGDVVCINYMNSYQLVLWESPFIHKRYAISLHETQLTFCSFMWVCSPNKRNSHVLSGHCEKDTSKETVYVVVVLYVDFEPCLVETWNNGQFMSKCWRQFLLTPWIRCVFVPVLVRITTLVVVGSTRTCHVHTPFSTDFVTIIEMRTLIYVWTVCLHDSICSVHRVESSRSCGWLRGGVRLSMGWWK